jgi:putative alpha-1,2-mannosidase
VREILKTQYKNTASGHCGNEDCGQMSSWYVFSSLGFYPVNAAQGIYAWLSFV